MLLFCLSSAEREAVNAVERAERKNQLREKVSCVAFFFFFLAGTKKCNSSYTLLGLIRINYKGDMEILTLVCG